jgi:hypothetical protein
MLFGCFVLFESVFLMLCPLPSPRYDYFGILSWQLFMWCLTFGLTIMQWFPQLVMLVRVKTIESLSVVWVVAQIILSALLGVYLYFEASFTSRYTAQTALNEQLLFHMLCFTGFYVMLLGYALYYMRKSKLQARTPEQPPENQLDGERQPLLNHSEEA